MKARKTVKAINPEESNQSTERYFYSTSLLGLKNVFYCSTREPSEPFTKSSFVKSGVIWTDTENTWLVFSYPLQQVFFEEHSLTADFMRG